MDTYCKGTGAPRLRVIRSPRNRAFTSAKMQVAKLFRKSFGIWEVRSTVYLMQGGIKIRIGLWTLCILIRTRNLKETGSDAGLYNNQVSVNKG